MFRALLIVCILLISVQTHAQLQGQDKIDSLLKELPKAKGDTNEVKLLKSLSFSYKGSNPDKGIEYGQKALALAKELGWRLGQARSHNSLASNNFYKSKFSEAINHYNEAIEIYEDIGNKKEAADIFNNIGAIYINQSNYPKAIEYLDKSLIINRTLGNNKKLAAIYENKGIIFLYQSNYPKALEYYNKALKLIENLENNAGLASIYGNIGGVFAYQSKNHKALEYFAKALEISEELGDKNGIASNLSNMGLVHSNQLDYPKSLEYFGKALKINEELGNKNGIASNLTNMGVVYLNKSNYLKALEYYEKALKIYEEQGDKNGIAITLGNMGELYLNLSQDSVTINPDELNEYLSLNKVVNLNKSIEYTQEAIKIYVEIGELNDRSTFLKNLADAYKLRGNYKKAYEALKEHHKLKDSVFNQENADKIAALEKAREDDLKQKEIEKQKAINAEKERVNQIIIYITIAGFIAMIIVLIVIYRLLKRSDKLLYNVLPVSIAKRLKKKEHPISDYFTQASIVFIDIVNFTEMAKDEDPQALVSNLNIIFTMYDTIANKYGLEKIKTIGDSYMAAAGIPEVQKDNTHRAAQMALEVKELMEDYHTADGTKIEVRIGLDCGPVVAGVIGENKFIYDMWSDAVNTASRMESSSESGQVHITERFKEAVSEYEEFEYVERGEIEIKGKGKMKTFYMGCKALETV